MAKKAALKAAKGFKPSKNILRHIDLPATHTPAKVSSSNNIPSLVCPTTKDSFDTWIQVSKDIICRNRPPTPAAELIPVSSCTNEKESFFDVPFNPSQYQLAFSPIDNEGGHDITCIVTGPNGVVRSNPLYPCEPIARMLEEQCLHKDPNKLVSKGARRKHIKDTKVTFMGLGDPETRLAAIAAQPSIVFPIFLAPNIETHAMFETMQSYGLSDSPRTSLMETLPVWLVDSNITMEKKNVPSGDVLLATLFPDEETQTLALALAIFDLYLRSYGASLYMDPLSVGALVTEPQPSFIQQSLFLLWEDSVLMALAASELGTSLLTTAPKFVGDACGLLHFTYPCAEDNTAQSSTSPGMDLAEHSDLVVSTSASSPCL